MAALLLRLQLQHAQVTRIAGLFNTSIILLAIDYYVADYCPWPS
jgi:hypothetical protein